MISCFYLAGKYLDVSSQRAKTRRRWRKFDFMQTLVVARTVSDITALKTCLFDAPLGKVFEKTGRFWTITNTFSERWNTLVVITVKIFKKTFTVFSQRAKMWRRGWKKWPIFRGFLAVVTWFLNFSKKSRLSINRVPDGTFVPNLVQIGHGQETAEKRWREKKEKKKSKSTEKHNITEILKNCIFAKTAI